MRTARCTCYDDGVRWLVLAVGLAFTSACSSSDDAAVDDASLDASADFGPDLGSHRCGVWSCCCKDGVQTFAACAADGSGGCAEGWTYHYDDCPFQSSCRAFDAALPDTPADGDAADDSAAD